MGSFFLVCLLAYLSIIDAQEPDNNLIITRASRGVDLTSSVVKQSVEFTFENKGGSPVSTFVYVIDGNVAANLAYISAEVS